MVSLPSLRVSQPFPATKIKFLPSRQASNRDLLITTSKNLSLWNLGLEQSTLDRVLDVRFYCVLDPWPWCDEMLDQSI